MRNIHEPKMRLDSWGSSFKVSFVEQGKIQKNQDAPITLPLRQVPSIKSVPLSKCEMNGTISVECMKKKEKDFNEQQELNPGHL